MSVPLEYLLECSRNSLKSFLLAQQNKAANHRKNIRQIMDEWVEAQALALLAEWLDTHGEELLELITSPRRNPEEPKHEKSLLTADSYRYEFWRSERRHTRRRTG